MVAKRNAGPNGALSWEALASAAERLAGGAVLTPREKQLLDPPQASHAPSASSGRQRPLIEVIDSDCDVDELHNSDSSESSAAHGERLHDPAALAGALRELLSRGQSSDGEGQRASAGGPFERIVEVCFAMTRFSDTELEALYASVGDAKDRTTAEACRSRSAQWVGVLSAAWEAAGRAVLHAPSLAQARSLRIALEFAELWPHSSTSTVRDATAILEVLGGANNVDQASRSGPPPMERLALPLLRDLRDELDARRRTAPAACAVAGLLENLPCSKFDQPILAAAVPRACFAADDVRATLRLHGLRALQALLGRTSPLDALQYAEPIASVIRRALGAMDTKVLDVALRTAESAANILDSDPNSSLATFRHTILGDLVRMYRLVAEAARLVLIAKSLAAHTRCAGLGSLVHAHDMCVGAALALQSRDEAARRGAIELVHSVLDAAGPRAAAVAVAHAQRLRDAASVTIGGNYCDQGQSVTSEDIPCEESSLWKELCERLASAEQSWKATKPQSLGP